MARSPRLATCSTLATGAREDSPSSARKPAKASEVDPAWHTEVMPGDESGSEGRAQQVSKDLTTLRQRGLSALDVTTHNQQSLSLPMLEALAVQYAKRPGKVWDQRGGIRRYLLDGLAAFRAEREYQADAELIDSLFFDHSGRHAKPGDLLDSARKKLDVTQTAFRTDYQTPAFLSFARFLVGWDGSGVLSNEDKPALGQHAPEAIEAEPTPQSEPHCESIAPVAVEAAEPSTPPSPASGKRVPVIAAVAALALVGVGIGVWQAADKPGHPTARSTAKPSSGSQPTSSASVSNASSEKFTPGTALQLTNSKLTDGVSGWSAVFPSHSAAAPFNPQSYAKLGDDIAFYTKELKAGAYGFRGFGVNVTANNVGSASVTISNVRVIDRKVSAPLAGDINVLPTQGEPTDQIAFNLDAATPVGKEYDRTTKDHLGKTDYFSGKTIVLTPHGKTETLALSFWTTRAAYSFNVAIDYTMDGKQYTQVVTNDGQPFRATASLCDAPEHGHYESILSRQPDASGLSYVLATLSPGKFCER